VQGIKQKHPWEECWYLKRHIAKDLFFYVLVAIGNRYSDCPVFWQIIAV
jgi:hypothetical protein